MMFLFSEMGTELPKTHDSSGDTDSNTGSEVCIFFKMLIQLSDGDRESCISECTVLKSKFCKLTTGYYEDIRTFFASGGFTERFFHVDMIILTSTYSTHRYILAVQHLVPTVLR